MTVDTPLIRYAEQLLGTAVGSSSASALFFRFFCKENDASPRDARQLLDDASCCPATEPRPVAQIARWTEMDQGITVLDKDLRLACWNRQFRKLFRPAGRGDAGRHLRSLKSWEHLSQRGDISPECPRIKRNPLRSASRCAAHGA
ncbi:PAS-domain containing protein [Brucella abortus]|nr:PAS-domain containing protein [Brucella abortus]